MEQICENPYLQYFVGLEGFQTKAPFDAFMMVHFRKRFSVDSMNRINEAMVLAAQQPKFEENSDPDDPSAGGSGEYSQKPLCEPNGSPKDKLESQGELLLDATCTPADIRYPTDLSLLKDAREKTEEIIDQLHQEQPQGSPARTASKHAKIIWRSPAHSRRNRWGIRKQLSKTVSLRGLKRNCYRKLLVISELYCQQQEMYKTRTKRIDHRIVSLWLP